MVVQNTFNREKFEAGKIYFLNTQKLGKKSLLVRGHDPDEERLRRGELFPEIAPDLRSYTIWDTIQNTIEDPDLTLYLVLDEAHRGMGTLSNAAQDDKSTIVKRLINGAGSVSGDPRRLGHLRHRRAVQHGDGRTCKAAARCRMWSWTRPRCRSRAC